MDRIRKIELAVLAFIYVVLIVIAISISIETAMTFGWGIVIGALSIRMLTDLEREDEMKGKDDAE